jgi:hypothetical protein
MFNRRVGDATRTLVGAPRMTARAKRVASATPVAARRCTAHLQRPVLVVCRHFLHEAEHLQPAHDAPKDRVLVVEVRRRLVA